LENRGRGHTKEVAREAVIRREEVVLAHIIIPIQITGNRINIIVNTLLVDLLISSKRDSANTKLTREAQDNREHKI
jgi:hypothetical protein